MHEREIYSNRAVLGILIVVALASSGLSLIINIVNNVDTSPAWWVSWLQNFSTEMFGAFLTFILIELIVGGREKRQDEERLKRLEKERLIRQMGSRVNTDAIRAVEEVWAHGWINDGSLIGAQLRSANLQSARFRTANLERAVLFDAILQGANLMYVNLKGSYMGGINLREAHLDYANLQSAFLAEAEFNTARLHEVNLEGAVLDFSQFDQFTFLPDGSNWTPDTDMRRFTDPTHPNFWRSDNPASPAYRNKENSN